MQHDVPHVGSQGVDRHPDVCAQGLPKFVYAVLLQYVGIDCSR
jgi:hypothetical protein